MKRELLERMKKRWRISALEVSQDAFAEVRTKLKAEEVAEKYLLELAKKPGYDFNGCGFIQKDDSFYVYATVPKFATQDGRNPQVFWPYETTRVAIGLVWSDNRAHSTNYPVVVERRECHPCLRDRARKGGFHSMCNLNRDSGSNQSHILDLVRKLSDAANVLMQPLNQESLNHHPGESYFGVELKNILTQGSLTEDQARQKSYTIVKVIAKPKE